MEVIPNSKHLHFVLQKVYTYISIKKNKNINGHRSVNDTHIVIKFH